MRDNHYCSVKDGQFREWLFTRCFMANTADDDTVIEKVANNARFSAYMDVIRALDLESKYQSYRYDCLLK